MPTHLVTGGAGFIGSHLVEALVARGDQVRVLDNLSSGKMSNLEGFQGRIELLQGSVTDLELVARAMRGVDCVFHQAALASVPLSVERPLDTNHVCVTGLVTVLDAARRAGVRRLVYAASSSAYGDQPTSSKRESDPVSPISPYGAAKLAGELYCQAFAATYSIETVCLRYFNIFGPRQDPDSPYSAVIPLFLKALLRGEPPTIYGDGLQSRDFCYVGNVVQANLLAAEAEGVSGRVFNIGVGRSTTLLDLLTQLNRLLGTNVLPRFAPPRPGDVRESLADITQAQLHLGYEAQFGLAEGLQNSILYYQHLISGMVK
jgi:UDP-glucose 4-epimerase